MELWYNSIDKHRLIMRCGSSTTKILARIPLGYMPHNLHTVRSDVIQIYMPAKGHAKQWDLGYLNSAGGCAIAFLYSRLSCSVHRNICSDSALAGWHDRSWKVVPCGSWYFFLWFQYSYWCVSHCAFSVIGSVTPWFYKRNQKNNTSTMFYVIEKCFKIPALQRATVWSPGIKQMCSGNQGRWKSDSNSRSNWNSSVFCRWHYQVSNAGIV